MTKRHEMSLRHALNIRLHIFVRLPTDKSISSKKGNHFFLLLSGRHCIVALVVNESHVSTSLDPLGYWNDGMCIAFQSTLLKKYYHFSFKLKQKKRDAIHYYIGSIR